MFAGIEAIVHGVRRRLSRNEWAIRHLGLTPSEGTAEEPGVLLIQIDGLARGQLEAALAAGRMPYLARLLKREGYELRTFYPGLPSTTPAVQAELFYGVHSAVPAFSFYDRVLKKLGRMWDPEWAKAREAACAKQAEGLLKGGSSWSNIYTGGAGQEESHFCAASIGFGDMWRTGKVRNVFLFVILQFPAALRIFWLLLVEFGVAVGDAARAIARGRKPHPEFLLLLSRVFVGVGLRELLTISGQIDVTRGLPIVHINFVGYDEHAHARGPGSKFAHFGLHGIDSAIRKIARAAHRSRRRDYAVWIFSDHGQEAVQPFPANDPGGVERVVRDCLALSQEHDRAWRVRSQQRTVSAAPWMSRSRRNQARLERKRQEELLTPEEEKTFAIAAMGPVGHVYFFIEQTDEQRSAVARRLVNEGKIPGVLVRTHDGKITWHHARGESRVPEELPSLLAQPAEMKAEIAKDLVTFLERPDAGDLVLLGWSPWGPPQSFAPERGAHGGLGPEETRGFLLLPAGTPLPPGTKFFVRPEALRSAARQALGRETWSGPKQALAVRPRAGLRLMTYNVHACGGMDGRVSPRRVARVIAEHSPDLVALQEVDLGRRRSRAEDQGAIIARELGMEVVFCPTITRGEEHYGHALLSRWPVEIVKRALLPHDPRSWWKEPRSALWVRIMIGETAVNLVTTHLGLGPRERLIQMQMLLGEDWLGGLPDDAPILMCGDFNLTPGSAPYRLAAARFRDVQLAVNGNERGPRPMKTFSSLRPFARLDHIFLSKRFAVERVIVPRNALTRVASDHLPLVADFSFVPAGAETTTRR